MLHQSYASSVENFSKIFIEMCMKIKKFEIEIFRKFSIYKISKISIGNLMKKKFEIEKFGFLISFFFEKSL